MQRRRSPQPCKSPAPALPFPLADSQISAMARASSRGWPVHGYGSGTDAEIARTSPSQALLASKRVRLRSALGLTSQPDDLDTVSWPSLEKRETRRPRSVSTRWSQERLRVGGLAVPAQKWVVAGRSTLGFQTVQSGT